MNCVSDTFDLSKKQYDTSHIIKEIRAQVNKLNAYVVKQTSQNNLDSAQLQGNVLARMLANAKEKTAASGDTGDGKKTPFDRMDDCRNALAYLDKCGWNRSFHQRLFHEDFLKACTRIFWKLEKAGQFARDHQKVLVKNNWDHLAQEVLISTPRRFGKTISVSMFAAAMLFAAPNVELSIYSTCKRISQKLLRNVVKFFHEICRNDLEQSGFKVVRQNMEEIVLRGTEGLRDTRIVNSYPSKVFHAPRSCMHVVSAVCVVCSVACFCAAVRWRVCRGSLGRAPQAAGER